MKTISITFLLVALFFFCKGQEPVSSNDTVVTYEAVETMPVFPGGIDSLNNSLNKNISYPVKAKTAQVQGHVKVKCVIDHSGKITNSRVIEGIGSPRPPP